MAAKRRHWKEKDGRFWARISVPVALRHFFEGKTQLTEPLGGDLRVADRNHAAAVARLQAQIAKAGSFNTSAEPEALHRTITGVDKEHAVWLHYNTFLRNDERKRAAMPPPEDIAAEYDRLMQKIDAGEVDVGRDPIGMFNSTNEYELKAGARSFDQKNRTSRLAALRLAVDAGDTHFVDAAVQQYVADEKLNVIPGSQEWRELAQLFTRAEIDALQRTLERDRGVFNDVSTDPIVKIPSVSNKALPPVALEKIFLAYIAKSQKLGRHLDGGRNWKIVFVSLQKFLGHGDARRLTKSDLRKWRDELMASGMSAKTVSDKYIAAVNAVLNWAFIEELLPSNEAEKVRQELPKKVQAREKGYTTVEAIKVLKASIGYKPVETDHPSHKESSHITSAKMWVPLLCAFTGARAAEMTQLRKEDIRQEGNCWILRITPDAGSVKNGHYRDVPLHRQVVKLGFCEFVKAANEGALFHRAKTADKFLAGARATAGKLSEWLQERRLVPKGVQPSYGWRHRFKTQGRELGGSDRVLDAIQGHPGKTASDNYGDVTIRARLRIIDALPDYDLTDVTGSPDTAAV